MLFLVGLELEPKRLWNLRRPIFGWGSAQVLGCTALLFAVAWAGRRALAHQPGGRAGPGAVVHRHCPAGDGRTQPAAHLQRAGGFFILLFQDVAAIPILALLPLLGTVSGSNEAAAPASSWLLEAIKIIAVIAGIILGGRCCCAPRCAGLPRATPPRSLPPPRCCWWWHCRADAAGGPVDGAGRLSGRRAAGRERVPARAGDRHRALQGPAAGPVLHRRGHEHRLWRAAQVAGSWLWSWWAFWPSRAW
jgi:hypothetical protein